jgi:hypothetical protein
MDVLRSQDASATTTACDFGLLDSSAHGTAPAPTRNPLLLFELDGLLLLRLAARALAGLLLNDPPRNTRPPELHVSAAFARQQSGGLKFRSSKNLPVKKIGAKNIPPNLFVCFAPSGATENSPPIHRWECRKYVQQVPSGTKECLSRQGDHPTTRSFLSSLPGLIWIFRSPFPSDKSLGYSLLPYRASIGTPFFQKPFPRASRAEQQQHNND